MPWSKSGRHGTASVTSYFRADVASVRMTISKTTTYQPRLFTMIPPYSGQCRGSAYGLNEVTMHTVPDCQRLYRLHCEHHEQKDKCCLADAAKQKRAGRVNTGIEEGKCIQ